MDTRLLILAFGTFAGATDGFVIGSLLPAIAGDSGATVAQAGYIVFGHALAYRDRSAGPRRDLRRPRSAAGPCRCRGRPWD